MVISAPFGNYVQPAGATATLGTFTLHRRPGRLWRIFRTLRYIRRLKAWVNRIGLRNPGVGWLGEQVAAGRIAVDGKIVSIHGFDPDEWMALLERVSALGPRAIELNMSCPNVGEIAWPPELFEAAARCGRPVIVKLPPVHHEPMIEQALAAGLGAFHCCNTLPVPAGGLSGPPLKPLSIDCLRRLRGRPGGARLTLVGGGGIRTPADIDDYVAAGADHVALGTRAMDPRLLFTGRPIAPLIARARERLGAGRPGAPPPGSG